MRLEAVKPEDTRGNHTAFLGEFLVVTEVISDDFASFEDGAEGGIVAVFFFDLEESVGGA